MQSKIKSIIHRLNRRDIPLLPKFRINKYFKIILILFVVLSAVFVTKTIIAQTTETTTETTTEETLNTEIPTESIQEFQAKQSAMEEGNNQESWMKESLGSNAMVGINVLAGTVPASVLEGKNTSWIPGGLIGVTTKNIATLYNIPISGTEYLAYVKDNFLGKSAYATNEFNNLSPLIPLWKGFRNATYILFSVIFVIIGILIMLRVKISPQATISIQSAIPKLITSLILVTFSYAIVGLLIDFSYVIAGLGISLISKASGINYDVIKTLDHPLIAGKMFGLVPYGMIAIISGIIGGILALINPIVGLVLGGIAFILLFLIISIFIIVQVFKFFIGLIKCYLAILLRTIIAPLEIALGAIPNMKMGFNTWFINVFANIMVFPVTLIFLVLAEILMTTIRKSSGLWTPPGLTFLLSGGDIIAIAIGMGSLLLISKLPKLIPEAIFQIKPSPFGTALGESSKGVGKTVGVLGSAGLSSAEGRYGYDKKEGRTGVGSVILTAAKKIHDAANH